MAGAARVPLGSGNEGLLWIYAYGPDTTPLFLRRGHGRRYGEQGHHLPISYMLRLPEMSRMARTRAKGRGGREATLTCSMTEDLFCLQSRFTTRPQ